MLKSVLRTLAASAGITFLTLISVIVAVAFSAPFMHPVAFAPSRSGPDYVEVTVLNISSKTSRIYLAPDSCSVDRSQHIRELAPFSFAVLALPTQDMDELRRSALLSYSYGLRMKYKTIEVRN